MANAFDGVENAFDSVGSGNAFDEITPPNAFDGVTAVGVGEAVLSAVSGLGGAFAGTVAGVAEEVQGRDFTPAFEHVMEQTNKVVQYKPQTSGGEAALEAIGNFYSKYVEEPLREAGEWVSEQGQEAYRESIRRDADYSPMERKLLGAFAEAAPMLATATQFGPEAVTMFAPVPGSKMAGRTVKKVAGKAKERLSRTAKEMEVDDLVDLQTGKPVKPDDVIDDKGTSIELLNMVKEKVKNDSAIPNDSLLGEIGRQMVFKPVEILRNWGSTHLTDLADAIYRPSRADKSANYFGTDLIKATNNASGEMSKAVERLLNPYRGRFRSVNKEADKAIVQGLRTGKVRPEYREITLAVRDFFDTFHREYANPVLKDVGRAENYFPQMWNVSKLLRSPKASKELFQKLKLIEEVVDESGNVTKKLIPIDEQMAEGIIRRIVENEGSYEFGAGVDRLTDIADLHQWTGRIKQGGNASRSMHEQTRKLEIPPEVLKGAERFLENDLRAVLDSYIHNMTRRVEYARAFGPKEEVLNAKVAAAIDELGIQNNASAVQRLTQDVYGLADALQGKYKPIQNLHVAKWNRRIANYETVAHLGLVSLASFPEIAAPAIQFGLVPTAYAKGFAHAVLEATAAAERVLKGGARKTPKLAAAEALETMGAISLNTIQSTQASRFTSASTKFTSKFMHATGLELLTDVQKVIAYETVGKVIKKSAEALAKGKGERKAGFHTRRLEELGITKEQAIEWYRTGAHGDVIENAKYRGQNWAITQPNPGTKPLLFSDPHWTNVLLFKSFTSVFSNVFMKRAVSELGLMKGKGELIGRRAEVIGAMSASIAIAYYTQFLREAITGQNVEMDDMERIVSAWDRSALSGPFTHIYALINPYRFGFSDTGKTRLFNSLGPALGDAARATDVVFNSEMTDKKRARDAAKFIPIINISKDLREEVGDELIKPLIP